MLSEQSDIVILLFLSLRSFLVFLGEVLFFLWKSAGPPLQRSHHYDWVCAVHWTEAMLLCNLCVMNCSPYPESRIPQSPGSFTETLSETREDFPGYLLAQGYKEKKSIALIFQGFNSLVIKGAKITLVWTDICICEQNERKHPQAIGFFPIVPQLRVFVLKMLLNSVELVCGKKVNWPVVVILNDSQTLLSNV